MDYAVYRKTGVRSGKPFCLATARLAEDGEVKFETIGTFPGRSQAIIAARLLAGRSGSYHLLAYDPTR